MNTNVSSVTALSVAPSQSNIIPFDPSTLSVKQLTKLGYTRSKIVKIKNLRPHRPVMPIKSLDDIQKCKDYFLNQETNYRNKSLNIRNYAIFCLDINIGLRASDLLFLKISDIMSARMKCQSLNPKQAKQKYSIFVTMQKKQLLCILKLDLIIKWMNICLHLKSQKMSH